jgi:hypothetical protein
MTSSEATPFRMRGERAVGYAWEGGKWSSREPPKSLVPMGWHKIAPNPSLV